MPVFEVRSESEEILFWDWEHHFNPAEEGAHAFLKPEEIGRALVSTPMDFKIKGCDDDEAWNEFASTLERLVIQTKEPQSIGLSLLKKSGQYQYRLILCSHAPFQRDKSKKDNDFVKLKMKINLLSNIPLEASRQQKEQGCLVQLARLCGPQNVNFRIRRMGNITEGFSIPWMEDPCILSWNEVDLCWEAQVEVTFLNRQLGEFESPVDDYSLATTLSNISSKIADDGVRNVLRTMYTGPGDNWKLQKQMLEEETFSDLVVISGNPENQKDPKKFKCHRIKLAEASEVFADMLQGNWEEAQTRTIKLPESEGAIEAMLHFIYYGGADRIYQPRGELVLELLQAAHKYNISNLVDLAAFVLHTEYGNGWSFINLETALQTISFARNLEGQRWTELREKCYGIVCSCEEGKRKQSNSWKKLCQIAKKLGPGFALLLENFWPDEDDKYIRKFLPGSLDGVEGLKREEAELFYDFLMSSAPALLTCDEAVGMFMLAEYLGRSVKEVDKKVKLGMEPEWDMDWPLKYYQVDYLVELFCLARQKHGKFWMVLKLGAVRKLEEFQTKQHKKIEASQKYKEMILGNAEVMEEFNRLKAAGLEEEGNMQPDSKRMRRN